MATKKKKDKIVFAFESSRAEVSSTGTSSIFRYMRKMKKTSELTSIKKYNPKTRTHVVFERKKA